MKNKMKRILATMLAVTALMSTSITSNANVINPNIPDGVVINYWTDYDVMENGVLLQHPAYFSVTAPEGVTYQITDIDVIAALKDMAPNGTDWGANTFYDTIATRKGKIPKRNAACQAFAFWVRDAIFGTGTVTRIDNTEDDMAICNGTFEFHYYDIVCYLTPTGEFHSGIVIDADPETGTLYTAEGNVNGVVNWDRSIKVDGSDGTAIARVYRSM